MKQGIVGGLLIVAGVIFSPFGPQILEWVKTLSFMVISTGFWVGNHVWTLWTHGGSDTLLWLFLRIAWAVFLIYAVALLFVAVAFVVRVVIVFALDSISDARMDLHWIFRRLIYSCGAFLLYLLFLYLTRLVDVGIGAWTTRLPVFTDSTYDLVFFWGVEGYLFAYPLSMVFAGILILQDSCRKWMRGMLRG